MNTSTIQLVCVWPLAILMFIAVIGWFFFVLVPWLDNMIVAAINIFYDFMINRENK
jgi:hypothetical protein